jgi:hypothetical protein
MLQVGLKIFIDMPGSAHSIATLHRLEVGFMVVVAGKP